MEICDEDIKWAGNDRELRQMLEWMMLETEKTIFPRNPTTDESRKLTHCLDYMRLLLIGLLYHEDRPGDSDEPSASCTGLVMRYLYLVGRVNEYLHDTPYESRAK